MSDSFTEQLVKQNATASAVLKRVAVVLGIILCVVIMIAVPIFFILPAAGIFALMYLWKRFGSVEFEYIYYNGEIDIDKIMGKEARKRVVSISAKDMTILAPTGSGELNRFMQLKTYDCSSKSGARTYEAITKLKEQDVRVIFEPNDEILQGMRYLAPRKVIL